MEETREGPVHRGGGGGPCVASVFMLRFVSVCQQKTPPFSKRLCMTVHFLHGLPKVDTIL